MKSADVAAIQDMSRWIASPATQNFYEIDVEFMTTFCVAMRSQGNVFALSGRGTFSDIVLKKGATAPSHDNGQSSSGGGTLGIPDASSVEQELGGKAPNLD